MNYPRTYNLFKPQLERMANSLAAMLKECGLTAEVWECLDDDSWGYRVTILNRVDVSIELIDAYYLDGTRDSGNISVTITGWGGVLIGQITPYNYTDNVWVKFNPAGRRELQERMDNVENSLEACAEVIISWLKGKAA